MYLPFRSNPNAETLALLKADGGGGQELAWEATIWLKLSSRRGEGYLLSLLAFYTTNLRQMSLRRKQVSWSCNNTLYGIGPQMEPEERQIEGHKEQKNKTAVGEPCFWVQRQCFTISYIRQRQSRALLLGTTAPYVGSHPRHTYRQGEGKMGRKRQELGIPRETVNPFDLFKNHIKHPEMSVLLKKKKTYMCYLPGCESFDWSLGNEEAFFNTHTRQLFWNGLWPCSAKRPGVSMVGLD